MSYFDSRVYECPVCQVELIRVVEVALNIGLVRFITDMKII